MPQKNKVKKTLKGSKAGKSKGKHKRRHHRKDQGQKDAQGQPGMESTDESQEKDDDDRSFSLSPTNSTVPSEPIETEGSKTRKESEASEKPEEPSESQAETISESQSTLQQDNEDEFSTGSGKHRRHRVKRYKKIRVKRKKYQMDHEDEEKQRVLEAQYDEMVREKEKREEKAAGQAAFADFSAVGQTPETLGRQFLKALYPVILLGKTFGRYPLLHGKDPGGSGFYVFEYDIKYPSAIYFLVANVCLTVLFVAGIVSMFSFWMEVSVGLEKSSVKERTDTFIQNLPYNDSGFSKLEPYEKRQLYLRNRPEHYVYDRHVVFFAMIWCYLLHNIISGWHFWFQTGYILKYFNFWIKAVNTMYMDVTKGAVLPILVGIGFSIAVTAGFIATSLLKMLPSMVGMPACIAIIIGRDFNPDLLKVYSSPSECTGPSPCFGGLFEALYFFGICLIVYLLMSAYFYVLLCMTICMYLKNAFLMWNGRVYASLLRGGDYIHSKEGRSTFSLLFKDHCTLLDLVEGTDRVFVYILESFTGLAVLSLCLEIYFIIRTAQKGYVETEETEYFKRPNDWVCGAILAIHHGVMLIMVLRKTAGVGEEAMAGLEIIRRKTMLGRKADEELYFMLSMFCSYTSDNPIALCGGGFFVCNKEYIIGVVATVISYFTLVFQFEPQLDFKRDKYDVPRSQIAEVICALERPRYQKSCG